MGSDQEQPGVLGVSVQTRIVEEDGRRYIVVPVRISVGEIVERRFPLGIWTDPAVDVEELGPGKEVMRVTTTVSRQTFDLGRDHVADMLRRRMSGAILEVDRNASNLGWYPDEEGAGAG